MTVGLRRLLCALAAAAAALSVPAPAADPVPSRVNDAALRLYVHGMTQEIADREVGRDGVPTLLTLLEAKDFPRRDNVVAFLAYLGGPETTPALLRVLAAPPSLATPEDERAVLLVPHALGRIAARGEPGAIAALLAMTEDGRNGGPIADAAHAGAIPGGLADDVLDAAIAGLALAGGDAGKQRLEAIAEQKIAPVRGRLRLATQARNALALLGEMHGTGPASKTAQPKVSPRVSPSGLRVDGGDPSGAAAATTPAYVQDPSTVSDKHRLTFMNHVSVTTPMDATRLDQVLTESTKRAATGDFDGDMPCCLVIARSGSAGTFGVAGDGLDTIDNDVELSAVLNNSAARVKVVKAINYCGGSGTNIIGCSWSPGDGMALVRLSSLGLEAVLWIHEYGHNVGLGHEPNDSRMIMYGTDSGSNNGIRAGDCAAFHAPPSVAVSDKSTIGACTADGDAIADPIDNCPLVANQDQLDSNHNGIGDACEACVGVGDSDGDGVCDPVDNCPTVPNPNQADFDHDGIGDACETGAKLADIDNSGRVDGYDLARFGHAFGSAAGDPRYDAGSDLDRNGMVDGNDLALFSAQFGKTAS